MIVYSFAVDTKVSWVLNFNSLRWNKNTEQQRPSYFVCSRSHVEKEKLTGERKISQVRFSFFIGKNGRMLLRCEMCIHRLSLEKNIYSWLKLLYCWYFLCTVGILSQNQGKKDWFVIWLENWESRKRVKVPIRQEIQSEDVLKSLLCMKYITEYLTRVAFPLLVQRLEVFVYMLVSVWLHHCIVARNRLLMESWISCPKFFLVYIQSCVCHLEDFPLVWVGHTGL